jgi:hypothetical protein
VQAREDRSHYADHALSALVHRERLAYSPCVRYTTGQMVSHLQEGVAPWPGILTRNRSSKGSYHACKAMPFFAPCSRGWELLVRIPVFGITSSWNGPMQSIHEGWRSVSQQLHSRNWVLLCVVSWESPKDAWSARSELRRESLARFCSRLTSSRCRRLLGVSP